MLDRNRIDLHIEFVKVRVAFLNRKAAEIGSEVDIIALCRCNVIIIEKICNIIIPQISFRLCSCGHSP